MRAIDLTNLRFGRLVAITFVNTNGKRRKWRFVCDCGTNVIVSVGQVTTGKTRSCGCLRVDTTSKRNLLDMTGKRFGRLIVVSRASERDSKNRILWNCLCNCGGKTTSPATPLNTGKKQSCGCIRQERMRALGLANKQDNPVSRTPQYHAAKKKRLRSKPERAMAGRISRLLAWALTSVGAIKRSATFEILGYTPSQLKSHLEKQFSPGMSWDNRSQWELDHIIPISQAACESDVIALNQLSNLRPIWALQNTKKGARRQFLI